MYLLTFYIVCAILHFVIEMISKIIYVLRWGVHHMKIAVVASNGKASQLIIKELLSRGHEVTGFARSANRSAVKNFVQKDILALTREDLAGFDAVVDGFGAYERDVLPLHTKTISSRGRIRGSTSSAERAHSMSMRRTRHSSSIRPTSRQSFIRSQRRRRRNSRRCVRARTHTGSSSAPRRTSQRTACARVSTNSAARS